jgi:hypothetical protein
MALRWKKNPRPSGLAGVCCGPQGSTLRIDGDVMVATVSPLNPSSDRWYWVAGWGHPRIPHKNTCSEPLQTEKETKAAAMAYVRACLTANAIPTGRECGEPPAGATWSTSGDAEKGRGDGLGNQG